MKPTPIQPRFPTSWRGYDRHEVDAFLRHVANEQTRLRQHEADLEAFVSQHQECDRTIQDLQARLEERQKDVERERVIRGTLGAWLVAAIPALTQVQTVVQSEGAPCAGARAAPSKPPMIAQAVDAGRAADVPPTATTSYRSVRSRALAYVLVPLSLAVQAVPPATHWRVPPMHASSSRHAPSAANRSAGVTGLPTPAAPDGRAAAPNVWYDGASGSSEPPGEDLTILLSARSLCWVRAVMDGERTLERLMKPGEGAFLHAKYNVVLRVGDAGAVSWTINGLAAKAIGRSGEVATTQITIDNYRRLAGSLE